MHSYIKHINNIDYVKEQINNNERMRNLMIKVENIENYGLNIIILCHSIVYHNNRSIAFYVKYSWRWNIILTKIEG